MMEWRSDKEIPLVRYFHPYGYSLIICLALFAVSVRNYVLFHTIVEGFTIIVAALIFVIASRTHKYSGDNFMLFVGYSYLCVAILDFFHTITFYGINIIAVEGSNTATQLWIAGRYFEAFCLLTAPLFITRKFPKRATLFGLLSLTMVLVVVIISTDLFPDCFIEGQGLTPFKVVSEYVISALLVAAMLHYIKKREWADPQVYKIMLGSMVITVASEMSFTLYQDVYGVMNFTGHILKLASYFLIYQGIVLRGLDAPYSSIFYKLQSVLRDLQRNQQVLEDQLTLARQIQVRNLPRGDEISGVDIEVLYQPLWQVGGDFCHVISYLSDVQWMDNIIDEHHTPKGKYGLIVGDVVGKGPGAALLMSEIVAATQMLTISTHAPAMILGALNERLFSQGYLEYPYLATASYITLDVPKREILFANAGHEPAIIFRSKTNSVSFLNAEGLMLGVDEGAFFEEISFSLAEGDKLILYTDGVIQCLNARDGTEGRQKLSRIIGRFGNHSAARLKREVEKVIQECHKQQLNDDCLLIVLAF